MGYAVTVSFGPDSQYEFSFPDEEVDNLPREDARRWLQAEFDALECALRSPVGKMLLLDVIVDVAKYGGEGRFASGSEWARRYAICCAAALERDTIRIDVPNLIVR